MDFGLGLGNYVESNHLWCPAGFMTTESLLYEKYRKIGIFHISPTFFITKICFFTQNPLLSVNKIVVINAQKIRDRKKIIQKKTINYIEEKKNKYFS